ncbi:hypothetical protein [Asanoa hainanensis]|uniref:hypothetical protein n=1 Tax=Asanoa hainanensis TaxID=560556 RepID=UPI00117FA8D6|nr:hypothetical protein [Asanoa hainanensis]
MDLLQQGLVGVRRIAEPPAHLAAEDAVRVDVLALQHPRESRGLVLEAVPTCADGPAALAGSDPMARPATTNAPAAATPRSTPRREMALSTLDPSFVVSLNALPFH